MEEDVFKCGGGVVKKMWIDESMWLMEEVDGRKTAKGALKVVEVGVGVTEAAVEMVVIGKVVAVVTICSLNAVAKVQS